MASGGIFKILKTALAGATDPKGSFMQGIKKGGTPNFADIFNLVRQAKKANTVPGPQPRPGLLDTQQVQRPQMNPQLQQLLRRSQVPRTQPQNFGFGQGPQNFGFRPQGFGQRFGPQPQNFIRPR